MRRTDRPDINTAEYWDERYREGERRGSWPEMRPFLGYEIDRQMDSGPSPISLIDVGGGTGLFAETVREEYGGDLELWNLDISPAAIEIGERKYPEVRHICHDMNDGLPVNLRSRFNFVVAQEIIEHVQQPIVVIRRLWEMVQPWGLLWVSAPHDEGDWAGPEHIHLELGHDDVHLLWDIVGPEVTFCKFYCYSGELAWAFKARKR